jgi:hypothetical protein
MTNTASNENPNDKLTINWWLVASIVPISIYGLSVFASSLPNMPNGSTNIVYQLLLYRYSPIWFYDEIKLILAWLTWILVEKRRGKAVGFGTLGIILGIALLFFSSQICAGFTNYSIRHLQTLTSENTTFHLAIEIGNFDRFFERDILVFRCPASALLCELRFRDSAIGNADYFLQYDESLRSMTLMQRDQSTSYWVDTE